MTPMLMQLLAVAVGGAIGGVARFWLSAFVARRFGEAFPWGTLAVNVSGAATIGVLAAIMLAPDTHAVDHVPAWTGLVVGILGSYTTVSTFSLETLALVRANEPGLAVRNIVASLLLCLGAATVGYAGVLWFLGG